MKRIKRRKRVALKLEIATNGLTRSPRTIGISETGDSDRDSMSSPSIRTSPFFVPRTKDGAQPSIR